MSTVQQEACLQPVGMAVPLKKVRPALDIVAIYNRDLGKFFNYKSEEGFEVEEFEMARYRKDGDVLSRLICRMQLGVLKGVKTEESPYMSPD